jgi:hypothetical protein
LESKEEVAMRRVLIALAVATMTLVGAQTAFAAAASQISIGFNTRTENFHGRVTSDNAECKAGRTVKLFKVTADGPTLQGKTTTNRHGHWKVEIMHAHGHYFAKTPTETVMHTKCDRARSRTMDVM